MQRYYKEVRSLDRAGLSAYQAIRDFVGKLYVPSSWVDVVTAHRIYKEDGGRRFTQDHFLATFPEFKPDVSLDLFERELEASGGIDAFAAINH